MLDNGSIDNDNFYFTTLSEINKAIPSSGFDFSYSEDKVIRREETLIDAEGQTSLAVKTIIDEAKRENLNVLKGRVEAILFLSDKPRAADSIAKQANTDVDLIRQVLAELVDEYEKRQGGITIDCSNGYCMQIADRYEDLTEDILPIALRTAVLRTLSTIALKEPILQKDLVTIRGGGVYEHVKELVDMGLVKKTKDGHQNLLHTTKFFSENFKLSQNGLELKTVLMKASPTDVEFVRPNTLIPGHEYEEEESDRDKVNEIKNTIQEKEEFLESN
jgi:segregation and condensation protein B